jgi:hypothetical protein
MTEWQATLRQLEIEPLTRDEASAMRDAMLSEAARAPTRRPASASGGVVIAGLLATAVAAGVMTARTSRDAVRATAPAIEEPVLRQMQFSTPGGTRIIWQFDPDFSLRETVP